MVCVGCGFWRGPWVDLRASLVVWHHGLLRPRAPALVAPRSSARLSVAVPRLGGGSRPLVFRFPVGEGVGPRLLPSGFAFFFSAGGFGRFARVFFGRSCSGRRRVLVRHGRPWPFVIVFFCRLRP